MKRDNLALNSDIQNISFHFFRYIKIINILFPWKDILLYKILFLFDKYIVDLSLNRYLASCLITAESLVKYKYRLSLYFFLEDLGWNQLKKK